MRLNTRRPGIKLQNAFFSLVPDAGYGSHRRQNRRRNRGDNLHNPLKSFLLRHNRLIDLMVNRMGEGRSPRPLFTFLLFYLFTFKLVLVKPIIPATGILRIPTCGL